MRFETPTKLELFLDGFHNILYAWDCYGTDEFWEALSIGWMEFEIYPFDDIYIPIISEKRRKVLDQKPPTIYLSAEDYDTLVERINQPPDPKAVERFREIMSRKPPWDE